MTARLLHWFDAVIFDLARQMRWSFVPPLLVNTFSWVSRPTKDGGPGNVLMSKHVAVMAASPGRLGGVRVVPRLRDCLCELGCVRCVRGAQGGSTQE